MVMSTCRQGAQTGDQCLMLQATATCRHLSISRRHTCAGRKTAIHGSTVTCIMPCDIITSVTTVAGEATLQGTRDGTTSTAQQYVRVCCHHSAYQPSQGGNLVPSAGWPCMPTYTRKVTAEAATPGTNDTHKAPTQ